MIVFCLGINLLYRELLCNDIGHKKQKRKAIVISGFYQLKEGLTKVDPKLGIQYKDRNPRHIEKQKLHNSRFGLSFAE